MQVPMMAQLAHRYCATPTGREKISSSALLRRSSAMSGRPSSTQASTTRRAAPEHVPERRVGLAEKTLGASSLCMNSASLGQAAAFSADVCLKIRKHEREHERPVGADSMPIAGSLRRTDARQRPQPLRRIALP
jgi:hypothetical protein